MSTHHFCYHKLGWETLCASLSLDIKVQENSLMLLKDNKRVMQPEELISKFAFYNSFSSSSQEADKAELLQTSAEVTAKGGA